MFSGSTFDGPLLYIWNVRNVKDMSNMFLGSSFNQPIGDWDTGSVTTMDSMFANAQAFNQDLSGWDVRKVNDMNRMFQSATAFNQLIGDWDTGSVTTMDRMFSEAQAFNQDLSGWDVRKVEDMNEMFGYASAFDQDIGGWSVVNVNSFVDMFLLSGVQSDPLNEAKICNGPSWKSNPVWKESYYGGLSCDSLLEVEPEATEAPTQAPTAPATSGAGAGAGGLLAATSSLAIAAYLWL